MSILSLNSFSFLITYEFWSRIGFLISYVVTSFLVLEVLRLVYTDVNKREVEKFLEGYAKQRTSTSPRRAQETRKVSLEELERPCTPPTRAMRDTTPESERTLVNEERRRRRAQSAASMMPTPPLVHGQVQAQGTTPPRRLRKRSDTVSSSESKSESKSPLRRRREASPASEAGSKASSRQGSPLRRVKKREDVGLGTPGFRGVVRGKV